MQHQNLHGFVLKTSEMIRDENDLVVLSYADIEFSGKPIVFLTPFSPSKKRLSIPTVVQVGETHVRIRDDNKEADYQLHVVLANPSDDEMDILSNPDIIAVSKSKTTELLEPYYQCTMKTDNAQSYMNNPTDVFLSSFWKDKNPFSDTVETFNGRSLTYHHGAIQSTIKATINGSSGNYATNYDVNILNIVSGNGKIETIGMFF